MNSSKVNDWVQIAATVGVLLGIVFVAEELRQNNELAEAQSIRDIYMEWQDVYRFEYEFEVTTLLAKPATELTDGEIDRLGSYYFMIIGAYLSQVAMEQRYGLAYNSMNEAPDIVRSYFSNPFGRAWFHENQDYVGYEGEDFLELLRTEIEATDIIPPDEYLQRIREQMLNFAAGRDESGS
jgi:hypothetical protein